MVDDLNLAEVKAWLALPLEQRIAYTAASDGLLDGDLRPLAAYLRAGWPLDKWLSEQIADAIEGPDEEGFTLRMVNRRGHKKFSDVVADHARRLDIALAVRHLQVEDQRRGLVGTYEAIIRHTMQRFGVSRSTVTGAVAWARKELGDRAWLAESDK